MTVDFTKQQGFLVLTDSNEDMSDSKKNLSPKPSTFTAHEVDFFMNFLRRHPFLQYIPYTQYTKIKHTDQDIHMYSFFINSNLEFKWANQPSSMYGQPIREHWTIPLDTKVCNQEEGKLKDLVMVNDDREPRVFKLQPVSPHLWEPLCVEVDGTAYLSHHSTEGLGLGVSDFLCEWPLEAEEWKHRNRVSGWPGQTAIEEVIKDGCLVQSHFLVDKETGEHIHWEYQFQMADNILVSKYIPTSVKAFYFLAVRVLSFLFAHELIFHCQQWKILFFFLLEKVTFETVKCQPYMCLRIMTDMLETCLKRRIFPDYYMKNLNTASPLSTMCISANQRCLKKVELLKTHTFELLFLACEDQCFTDEQLFMKCVDELTILAAEKPYTTSMVSYVDCFVPIAIQGIQNWVGKEQYGKAVGLIDVWLKNWSKRYMDCRVGRSQFIQQVLDSLPDQAKWLLALYIDCKEKSNWLINIENSEPSVPLAYIVGQDLQSLQIVTTYTLSEIRVPKKLVVHNSTYFVSMVFRLMEIELEWSEAAIWFSVNFLKHHCQYLLTQIVAIEDYHTFTSSMMSLVYIFKALYAVLYERGDVDQFLDVLLLFHRTCVKFGRSRPMQFLADLWQYFGDTECMQVCQTLSKVYQNTPVKEVAF